MADLKPTRVSRRDVMRLAGLGAVAAAGAGLLPRLPGGSMAAAAGDDRPEAFLAFAYNERSRAATTGDHAILNGIYDGANGSMIRFERERASYLARGIGAAWAGTFLEHSSTVALSALTTSATGTEATAKLVETFSSRWVPTAQAPDADTKALMAAYPDKYRDTTPRGAKGDITSVAIIPHEVQLLRGSTGWRIARDQHDEFFLAGRSPDLVPGSWAAIWYGKARGVRAGADISPAERSTKGPGLSRPLQTQYTYDWNAAKWYAQTYATSPYSGYCNYNCCGGDCTNFVSQCYRQGGEVDQSPWLTNAGYCGQCDNAHCLNCPTSCPHTATYMGSDTWANVDLANTFFTSSTNRATVKSSISQVSTADYIDYNFGSGYAAGHKTIISQPNGTLTRVCSHTPFVKDYLWNSFGTATNRFVWMNQYYDA